MEKDNKETIFNILKDFKGLVPNSNAVVDFDFKPTAQKIKESFNWVTNGTLPKESVPEVEKVNLTYASPWIVFARKVYALFCRDEEIKMTWRHLDGPATELVDMTGVEDAYAIVMYVNNPVKGVSLETILPAYRDFGKVRVFINIVPSNEVWPISKMFDAAFENNPVYGSFVTAETLFGPTNYVLFSNEAIQYFADDIGDYYGVETTTAEELAKEVFNEDLHVNYCTEKSEFVAPIWPNND